MPLGDGDCRCGLCCMLNLLNFGVPINPKEFDKNYVHVCPQEIWEGPFSRIFGYSRSFDCNGLFEMKRAELQTNTGTVPRDTERKMG